MIERHQNRWERPALVHFKHTTIKTLPWCSIWMAPGILRSDCVCWKMKPPKRSRPFVSFSICSACFLDLKGQMETSNSDHKNMFRLRYAWWHGQLVCIGLCCLVGEHLFEQDWQSLIRPDGAESEVGGLYRKMGAERRRVAGRDGSILGFDKPMRTNRPNPSFNCTRSIVYTL